MAGLLDFKRPISYSFHNDIKIKQTQEQERKVKNKQVCTVLRRLFAIRPPI